MTQGWTVQDLGELVGEVLIFGGPYSNLQATNALIREADGRRISASNCICTGDAVAYCANPVETVGAIRKFGCHVVAGNCDKQLAANATDCGCGFEAGTVCDSLAAGWYAFADSQVKSDERAWMARLPDIIRFSHAGRVCAVIHGGFQDIARFIWPSSDATIFREEIRNINGLMGGVDVVIAGHSGIAFTCDVDGVVWINPGVIGMPPHDGRAETRFGIMSQNGVQFHRLYYNAELTARSMEDVGLTQGYHHSLSTGVWPSEDVLPIELRR